MKVKILPSLLAADFGTLRSEAVRAEESGADALHIDIMDAHFVPNLSMGPDVVKMADSAVRIPLSVHLMMSRPDKYLDVFIDAGADTLFVHAEVECDIAAMLEHIRNRGIRPGLTLNPETPAESVFPHLDNAEEILCMTVYPGYGGQKFMAEVIPKIEAVRQRSEIEQLKPDIMVDGGIDCETAPLCAAAGANAFVAGTSLYRAEDMSSMISEMRRKASESLA